MSTPAAPLTPQRIQEMAWGYAAPLILEAALKNRIFDVLDEGPKTVDEVHALTGASVRGLRAVMDALCGFAFLDKDAADTYSLTPESAAFLVSTKPSFAGGLIRHTSNLLPYGWLRLSDVVHTGKPMEAVNQQERSAFFEELVPQIFSMSYPAAQALARHLNLTEASVLDVAAGSGVWGLALAESSPQVRYTAVDWPSVLNITERIAAEHGVADRFTGIPGDIRAADFGSGYDVATLGHILHSEGVERSRGLLKKIHVALAPGGVIAIAEFLVNADRKGPIGGLIFNVNMLVHTEDGATFSFEEIRGWLREAGFVNSRLLDAPGPSPLILATKP